MARLLPSTQDDIHLACALEGKYLELCDRYKRVHGRGPLAPADLNSAFMRWRSLIARYKQGDLRHTKSENQAVKDICQWTVDVNNKLCGQPPAKIQWKD